MPTPIISEFPSFPDRADVDTTWEEEMATYASGNTAAGQSIEAAFEWLVENIPCLPVDAAFVSAASFTVAGDLTDQFEVGVRVRADCGTDGERLGTVTASSYSAPSTTVTVALDSGSLTTNLSSAHISKSLTWATTAYPGVSELATAAEAVTGADTARIVTVAASRQAFLSWMRDTVGEFPGLVLPVYNLYTRDLALPSSTTFTRASSATRVNAAGRIESETTNIPRFDFDPATGELLGLRIEGAATNLVTYAEQANNAAWLKTQGSVTADAGTAPDGAATADTFIENTAADTHFLSLPSVSSTAGATYSISTYLRSAGRTRCRTSLPPTRFGTSNTVAFWFDTGAYEILAGTPAVFVQEFVDSWWRVASAAQVTSGVTGPAGYIWNVDATGNATYTGDGSSGLYAWGAQAEANAFPTSYVPTTTTAATRAADVCTVALSGLDAFNTREGALYVAARTPLGVGTVAQVLAQIDDGSESNRIRIERDTSQYLRCIVTVSGVEQANLNLGAVDDDTDFRVTFAWASGAFAAALDAGTDVTDAAGSVPTGLATLRLGQSYTGEHWHGTIKHLALFPAALTAAQRQSMAL